MDNEEDIEIATERLVKDNQSSRLHALSALRSNDRLIEREKSKAKIEPDRGFHDDM